MVAQGDWKPQIANTTLDWPLSTPCSLQSKHTDGPVAPLRCLCLLSLCLLLFSLPSHVWLLLTIRFDLKCPCLCKVSPPTWPLWSHCFSTLFISNVLHVTVSHYLIYSFVCTCCLGRTLSILFTAVDPRACTEQALRKWVRGSRGCFWGEVVPAWSSLHCQRVWWLLHLYLQLAAPSLCCDSFLVRDHFQLKSA